MGDGDVDDGIRPRTSSFGSSTVCVGFRCSGPEAGSESEIWPADIVMVSCRVFAPLSRGSMEFGDPGAVCGNEEYRLCSSIIEDKPRTPRVSFGKPNVECCLEG